MNPKPGGTWPPSDPRFRNHVKRSPPSSLKSSAYAFSGLHSSASPHSQMVGRVRIRGRPSPSTSVMGARNSAPFLPVGQAYGQRGPFHRPIGPDTCVHDPFPPAAVGLAAHSRQSHLQGRCDQITSRATASRASVATQPLQGSAGASPERYAARNTVAIRPVSRLWLSRTARTRVKDPRTADIHGYRWRSRHHVLMPRFHGS